MIPYYQNFIVMQKKLVKNYILGEKLGEGCFSIVYKCTDKITQKVYACKQLLRSKMTAR